MNIYHIWCNLKEDVTDRDFCDAVVAYLGHLQDADRIAGYRITRRKLGLGPAALPEFHIAVETRHLAQLDSAFDVVASRTEPVAGLHRAVNTKVRDVTFALYRDFPD